MGEVFGFQIFSDSWRDSSINRVKSIWKLCSHYYCNKKPEKLKDFTFLYWANACRMSEKFVSMNFVFGLYESVIFYKIKIFKKILKTCFKFLLWSIVSNMSDMLSISWAESELFLVNRLSIFIIDTLSNAKFTGQI